MVESWQNHITSNQAAERNMREIAAYVEHILGLKRFHQGVPDVKIKHAMSKQRPLDTADKGNIVFVILSDIPGDALEDYQHFAKELKSLSSPDGDKVSMGYVTAKGDSNKYGITLSFFNPCQDCKILKHSDPQNFRAAVAPLESNLPAPRQ